MPKWNMKMKGRRRRRTFCRRRWKGGERSRTNENETAGGKGNCRVLTVQERDPPGIFKGHLGNPVSLKFRLRFSPFISFRSGGGGEEGGGGTGRFPPLWSSLSVGWGYLVKLFLCAVGGRAWVSRASSNKTPEGPSYS